VPERLPVRRIPVGQRAAGRKPRRRRRLCVRRRTVVVVVTGGGHVGRGRVPTPPGRVRVRQVHGRRVPPGRKRCAAVVPLVPAVELDGPAQVGPGERVPDVRIPAGRAGTVRGRPPVGLLRTVQIRPKRPSARHVVLRYRTRGATVGDGRDLDGRLRLRRRR